MTPFQKNIGFAVLTLISWSLFMWSWMYAKRLPAIKRSKMKLDPMAKRGEQMSQLPAKVRWIADNYNHLSEQPTHFYPLAVLIILFNLESQVNITFTWIYVILRIIHSFFQSLINIIAYRFLLFALSSVCLIVLVIHNFILLID